MLSHLSLASLLLCGLLLVGCDTTDPVSPVDPVEVTGSYNFQSLQFMPTSQGIVDADVLARLVADETRLTLVNTSRGGQFQLFYRFDGELTDIISGTYTATANNVTLTVREEDRASISALLLDPTMTFERVNDETLSIDRTKTVDLRSYDPEVYASVDPNGVPGRLVIRLVRQSVAD